jgi:hypothetical protein
LQKAAPAQLRNRHLPYIRSDDDQKETRTAKQNFFSAQSDRQRASRLSSRNGKPDQHLLERSEMFEVGFVSSDPVFQIKKTIRRSLLTLMLSRRSGERKALWLLAAIRAMRNAARIQLVFR